MPGLLDGPVTTAPTRAKRPGGKMHRLAYVNADEARLLRERGGGVTPDGGQLTWGGVPSFDEGDGDGGGDGGADGGADGNASDNDSSNSTSAGQDAGAGVGGTGAGSTGAGAGSPGAADADTGETGMGDVGGYGGYGDDANQNGANAGPDGGGWNTGNGLGEGPSAPWRGNGLLDGGGGPGGGFQVQLSPTPVYSGPAAAPPPPLVGQTTPGMVQALAAMRAAFGPRPLPGSPPPGGGPAAGGSVPMGAWRPPVLAPNGPAPMILNGQGGGPSYYEAMRRLAPQQMSQMGYIDPTHRRW